MNYKKTVLENGLRIITVPMKDNPTVTVFVLVEAGSKYEKREQNGLSHFLEHMCFKGTEKRPESSDISTELDSIGAVYNAFTGHEYTGYYAKAQFARFDELLDVVSDMYLNPLLPQKEIDKERGVIIEEINMYEDLPQHKVQNLFFNLVYGDTPAGWTIAGPRENIKKFSREDFTAYRKRLYVAPATTVIVAGNFNEKRAISAVEKIFGALPSVPKAIKAPVKEGQKAPAVALAKKDTDQAHMVLGFRSFDLYDKRARIMDVLVGVLDAGMSSRLFKKLRDEMGACYYINASQDAFTDHGIFNISAGVDNLRVKEVTTVILSELKKLKTDLVGEEELAKVKNNIIGTMYLGLESSNSLAKFFGFQEIMNEKIKTPDDIKGEIEAVTAKAIRDLAREIFVSKNLNLAFVGRFEDKGEFEAILEI